MSDITENEEDLTCTPEEISNQAKEIVLDLLPEKSKKKYDLAYKLFMDWCLAKKVQRYSENVILTYLSELALKYKSSSLWSIHSMLKATLLVKNNVKIQDYTKVTAFLKKKSIGYVPKQSSVFLGKEINTFLKEAADEQYLLMKVVLILGIAGACRCDELVNLTVGDITEKDDILVINIRHTKTYKPRTFIVCNVDKPDATNVISICKKYFSLRPKAINSNKVLIKYNSGKCCAQNVGIHTIGKIPSIIAEFLKLPNSASYTGHCLRRSSTTLLADSGADIRLIQRHGGWKSATVAESYVEDSIRNKVNISKRILNSTETNATNIVPVPIPAPPLSEEVMFANIENLPNVASAPSVMENLENENPLVNDKATFTTHLSNLTKQGIFCFSNCTILNPTFNINAGPNN